MPIQCRGPEAGWGWEDEGACGPYCPLCWPRGLGSGRVKHLFFFFFFGHVLSMWMFWARTHTTTVTTLLLHHRGPPEKLIVPFFI